MRSPSVAGQFYPAEPNELRAQIEESFLHRIGPGEIPELVAGGNLLAVMAPHAGYMFSGPVAAHSYYQVARSFPEDGTFVIIGPNHTGYGAPIALSTQDWIMPFGNVRIDRDLADILMDAGIPDDMAAHRYEHSVEVQVPFIQYFSNKFEIVPIVMMDQSMRSAIMLGDILRKAIAEHDRRVLIVASTDFSHYVPKDWAYKYDAFALEMIQRMDIEGLYRVIKKYGISMCGYGPVAATIEAIKDRVRTSKILKYATSGDVISMPDVVGYGSAAWWA
jgi:AmmeMemoRadiSam system protein B